LIKYTESYVILLGHYDTVRYEMLF